MLKNSKELTKKNWFEAIKDEDIETIKIFIENGFDVNVKNAKWGQTAFVFSIQENNTDIAEYLIEVGADIHTDNDQALQWASFNGNLKIFKYIVDHSVDSTVIHVNNDYILRMASVQGHLEIIKILVEKSGDIHIDNNYALVLASSNGHLEIVKYLVEHGADIHTNNDCILRWASNNYHFKIVKYLKSL